MDIFQAAKNLVDKRLEMGVCQWLSTIIPVIVSKLN